MKYIGLIVIYKITDPKSFLLCTLDGKLLLGLFEHKRLRPTVMTTSYGNVTILPQLQQVLHIGIKLN